MWRIHGYCVDFFCLSIMSPLGYDRGNIKYKRGRAIAHHCGRRGSAMRSRIYMALLISLTLLVLSACRASAPPERSTQEEVEAQGETLDRDQAFLDDDAYIPVGQPRLVVRLDAILFDGEVLEPLHDGRVESNDQREMPLLIPSLLEALADLDGGGDERLHFEADVLVPYRTFTEVLYTAGQSMILDYLIETTADFDVPRGAATALDFRMPTSEDIHLTVSEFGSGGATMADRSIDELFESSASAEDSPLMQPTEDIEPASEPEEENLQVTFAISGEGILVSVSGQNIEPIEGCPSRGPTICLTGSVGNPLQHFEAALQNTDDPQRAGELFAEGIEAYDFRSLYNVAVEIADDYPGSRQLTLVAAEDIPMGVVTRAFFVVGRRLDQDHFEDRESFNDALDEGGADELFGSPFFAIQG